MPVNTKIQIIIDAVSDKLAQYTTPNSITPQVVTEAIALSVQSLYSVPDVFMANNNVETIDFTNYVNVERLFAQQNPFTSLDLLPMVNLKHLELSSTYLTEIDFSANVLLEKLIFMGNEYQIPTIDFSTLTNLKELQVGTQLESINLSTNILLEKLELNSNLLTSIDLSNNILLNHLDLSENQLENLDISNNPEITYLNLHRNNLTETTVNQILADLVLANKNNGKMFFRNPLSFTNSNAQPTGQGLLDIATLESRGWEVIYLNE